MPLSDGTSSVLMAERLHRIIQRYAPLFLFHRDERHFPYDPDGFRRIARFRESRPGKDRGWNRLERKWNDGDDRSYMYYDAKWSHIIRESLLQLGHEGPGRVSGDWNLRPRDHKNPRQSPSGLFLQRSPAASQARSGFQPDAQRQVHAPLLVDAFHNPTKGIVKVLFWFFYELNWFYLMLTHQGDWEHLTLFWCEDEFEAEQDPRFAYLAYHETGEVRPFPMVEKTPDGHSKVYVNRNGHPSCFGADHRSEYVYEWRTWEQRYELIEHAEWRDFPGAWGEVGEWTWSTGPLGPSMKLHSDHVEIVEVDAKPCVVVRKAR